MKNGALILVGLGVLGLVLIAKPKPKDDSIVIPGAPGADWISKNCFDASMSGQERAALILALSDPTMTVEDLDLLINLAIEQNYTNAAACMAVLRANKAEGKPLPWE